MKYLLHHEPSDEIVVPQRLLPALDRLLAAIKGEPGAEWVRLRVKGLGSARLVLQAADRPKGHRGFDELECVRRPKLDAGAQTKVVDMHIKLEALRDAPGSSTEPPRSDPLSTSGNASRTIVGALLEGWPMRRRAHSQFDELHQRAREPS